VNVAAIGIAYSLYTLHLHGDVIPGRCMRRSEGGTYLLHREYNDGTTNSIHGFYVTAAGPGIPDSVGVLSVIPFSCTLESSEE
jgi:hypothetical protein